MSDSVSYQQIVSSPVIGATAAVAIGAAYLYYRQTNGRGPHSPCPVTHKKGFVLVSDMQASDERKRDFSRFLKSESVYIRSRTEEVSLFPSHPTADAAIRDLVKRLPKGTDIDALVYGLSTSVGMDVLTKIGISPPFISQPLFVVHAGSGEIELIGFVGKHVRGTRPDFKHTDWVIRIKTQTNKHAQIEYEVKYANGCERTADFIM